MSQQLYFNQNSVYQSPGPPATPAPSPTNSQFSVPWNAQTTSSVTTVGAGASWDALPDVLTFGLDYNLAYGDTAYALGEGIVAYGRAITSPTFQPSITMQPLPDVKSLLSVISLHGEYTLSPKIKRFFFYAWERFTSKDFMMGTSTTQCANALLPGTLTPNESVQAVSAGLHIRF